MQVLLSFQQWRRYYVKVRKLLINLTCNTFVWFLMRRFTQKFSRLDGKKKHIWIDLSSDFIRLGFPYGYTYVFLWGNFQTFQGCWIEGMLGDHFVEVLYRNTPFFNKGHAFWKVRNMEERDKIKWLILASSMWSLPTQPQSTDLQILLSQTIFQFDAIQNKANLTLVFLLIGHSYWGWNCRSRINKRSYVWKALQRKCQVT